MSSTYTSNDLVNAIAAASKNLSARKDEVNRLNVFPVPDGARSATRSRGFTVRLKSCSTCCLP